MIKYIILYYQITGVVGSLLVLFFNKQILSLARVKNKPKPKRKYTRDFVDNLILSRELFHTLIKEEAYNKLSTDEDNYDIEKNK